MGRAGRGESRGEERKGEERKNSHSESATA